MREAFHDQIDSIHHDLAEICSQVGRAVHGATRALLEGNTARAEEVIGGDAEIDRSRERVEERALLLLSLQAPVAGDLRTVVAALRIVNDLERMGNLSVHVAKVARLRVPNVAVPLDLVPTVARMAQIAEEMVAGVVPVVRDRDVAPVAGLEQAEAEMDALRRSLFTVMLKHDWAHGVEAAVDVALLGRYYERIADHALAVAHQIVFVVTGQSAAAE